MKILLLCKKFPYPLKDGESLAVHSLSKALVELGCQVSLLAMNTRRHYYRGQERPAALSHFTRIETVDVDNRIKPKEAFLNLFSDESYHVARFVSPAFARALQQMLDRESYDVVQLETLYLAPYVPIVRRYSKAAVAMRAHNVEHEIWERISAHSQPGPRKWYLNHLTRKLRTYETRHLNTYDLLVPITDRDLQLFRKLGCRVPACVAPIGLPADRYEPDFSSFHGPISLSFIGSLDWMPNIEGLKWFLEQVWPRATRLFPQLELHIAGRHTPDWLLRLRRQNVTVHGEVPRADEFINRHSMMVVPLLSGSGMRAKILEAMALGKVVISTRIGLEGIGARDREEVMVADTPEEFLQALLNCHSMNGSLEKMGRRAHSLISEQYDHRAVAERLVAAYSELLPVAVG